VIAADGARPPIDEPCGECPTPETLAASQAPGVPLKDRVGYGLRGIRFVQRDASVSVEFPEGSGIRLLRTLMHQELTLEAEKRGVRSLWKTPVTAITSTRVQLSGMDLSARWSDPQNEVGAP
jgi:hypothetical protein